MKKEEDDLLVYKKLKVKHEKGFCSELKVTGRI